MTPEIPPGCHSMEERDKRSATETGKSTCRASSGLLWQHRRQHRQQAMLRKGSETKLIGSVVDNKFNSAVCCLHTFLLRNLINLLNKLVASRVSCSRSIFFLFVTHQQIILHLSASYNELPTSLSDWTVLKQMPSVAPEGSKVTAHDVNTSYDCKHLDLYFLIRPQPLCHLTFSDDPPHLQFPFQYYHHHFLLPRSLHLFSWPGQRLVREPGPMFALECEEEAELPQLRGRGVLRPSSRTSRSSPKPAGLLSLGAWLCSVPFYFVWN